MAVAKSATVDSLVLIERLDELMAEAKPIPFTREARVERDEVYKILDQLRTTLPVEFERVRWIGRESEQEDGVESRLKEITSALTELREAQAQAQRSSTPPLTVAAAEQVREIIEAAERTAAAIERDANAEAQRLRTEADAHLRRAKEEAERHLRETRERAAGEAAAYLSRVEEATKKMLERAESAGSEINGILANLRGSGGSVIEDLEAIMAGLTKIEVRRTEAAAPAKAAAAPSPQTPASAPGGVTQAATSVVARRPQRVVASQASPSVAPPASPAGALRRPAARPTGAVRRLAPSRVPATEPAPATPPAEPAPSTPPDEPARRPTPMATVRPAPASGSARPGSPPGQVDEEGESPQTPPQPPPAA